MTRLSLWVNRAAGSGRRHRWLAGVDRDRFDVRVVDREAMLDGLREAVSERAERVIVAGGDGTIHHAIQVLAGTETSLGIVPVGSGNDFATSLGLSASIEEALHQALDAPATRVDLGRIGERYFACVAGVGIDGAVLETIESWRWRPPRQCLYPAALLRTLPGYRPGRVELELEAGSWSGEATILALANTPLYGGGMQIAPEARPDDGRLEVVAVGALPKWQLLRLFPRVYTGRHVEHAAVELFSASSGRLQLDRAERISADGEKVTVTDRITFGIAPKALRVVAARPTMRRS